MNIIRKWLDKIIEVFGCCLIIVMVAIACWQVVSRYIFNAPSTFSEEFLRFSLVWLSVIGVAYVAGKHEHISLTLLLDKCPKKLTVGWNIVIQVVFILFAIYIMIIGGWRVSATAMMQISPSLQVSMGKVYYALPLSGVLTIIYCLLNIVDMLRGTPPGKRAADAAQDPTVEGGRHD
ncbi:TRAP transporter small permease [Brenneria corticis]|uniref:TRAP transporter small permease protein n=1 Tax=Brenneria corticis TaxID=2173106 RepID=A0A2U1TWX7_9GAMM|nr:TRAP transporter small permease [Brenneria sp. CFCC 11842]PWC13911.1 TRAP transporter small permease [Brenneria sp. CFCC 11842]